jgi:hypothetical protein
VAALARKGVVVLYLLALGDLGAEVLKQLEVVVVVLALPLVYFNELHKEK